MRGLWFVCVPLYFYGYKQGTKVDDVFARFAPCYVPFFASFVPLCTAWYKGQTTYLRGLRAFFFFFVPLYQVCTFVLFPIKVFFFKYIYIIQIYFLFIVKLSQVFLFVNLLYRYKGTKKGFFTVQTSKIGGLPCVPTVYRVTVYFFMLLWYTKKAIRQ